MIYLCSLPRVLSTEDKERCAVWTGSSKKTLLQRADVLSKLIKIDLSFIF